MKKSELANEIKLLLGDVIFKSGLYISKNLVSQSFFSDCGLLVARIYSLMGKVAASEHEEMSGTLEQTEFVSIVVSKSELFLLPEKKIDHAGNNVADSEGSFHQSFNLVFDAYSLDNFINLGLSESEKKRIWNAENLEPSEPALPNGGEWIPEDFDADAVF